MRNIKLLNILINFTENLYEILLLIKTNMKIYVMFSLNMLKRQEIDLFNKHEYKNKIQLFLSY